jgi:UDP-N-acetylmuramate dehydrogenase
VRAAFLSCPAATPGDRERVEIALSLDQRLIDQLTEVAPDGVLVAEPMARHTSYGLGGPADLFIEPSGVAEFRHSAALLADSGTPVLILGHGTNVLVRSGGVRAAVLSGRRAFSAIERTERGVRAGAGAGLSKVLSYCAEEGLSGIEGLAGIPGTAGGAVATNAGSFGVTLGERLAGVAVSVSGSEPRYLSRNELSIGYRKTELPAGAFVEHVDLTLDPGDPAEIRERVRRTLEKKWKTQPSGMRSAGCVFKNPPELSAGRLIEEAGLKGRRIGGAVVSDLHANFILNDRAATAEDVERLIEFVRERVQATFGVALELEVEIVGERAG